MNALLQEFIEESRDVLQRIGQALLEMEHRPDDPELMQELFRLVHTLKGNSGIFDFPELTRVLHAGEDVMDAVRSGTLGYSQDLADRLLDAMDFVGALVDEIARHEALDVRHSEHALNLSVALRELLPGTPEVHATDAQDAAESHSTPFTWRGLLPGLSTLELFGAWQQAEQAGHPLWLLFYRPEEEAFFKGEDPFHQARTAPGLYWGTSLAREPWGDAASFDCYRCLLDFHLLAVAPRTALDEHFRYIPEQVCLQALTLEQVLAHPDLPAPASLGERLADVCEQVRQRDAQALASLTGDDGLTRWVVLLASHTEVPWPLLERLLGMDGPRAGSPLLSADDQQHLAQLLTTQGQILAQPDRVDGLPGRLEAVANTLEACLRWQDDSQIDGMQSALRAALDRTSAVPLGQWLADYLDDGPAGSTAPAACASTQDNTPALPSEPASRRADDPPGARVLKVDQGKVDRLMNLIGEMVVAKNALPYLANRAENQYGSRELAREIKAQYAVINRIAEEMQDAIMQVRMMPMSFIFQRFPRLVRDISRKLGKEVELVLEGEDTEADKHIIESLADPLVHILRNSLDHGLETPDERARAGKPKAGRLLIQARQDADRVTLSIQDDGRGIDPARIRRKAYEKGLMDEAQLERLTDQEAIQLVFAAGFSTSESVSDLSGRGVGMDVVRRAIDRVGGTIQLGSTPGQGTRLDLSLPLSMAVTNVMVIESDGQVFGIPMDAVVETVRLPREAIRPIKQQLTTVLRNRVIPLKALNELLAVPAEPLANEDDELAALVVRLGSEQLGLLVDDFREVIDVILKPLPGELARLDCYAGSALLGDGTVLMVLNPKGLIP